MSKKLRLFTRKLLYSATLVFLVSLLSVPVFAQDGIAKVTYTGTISTTDNKPLAKASITTKDGKFGTTTNEEGKFSFSAPKANNRILVVSSVGYKTTELRVGNNTEFNIKLQESTGDLGEVVVIGYGSRRRADLSGAVTQVNSDLITNQPITSIDQGLAGLIPGVTLREGTGAPGAGPEILVRGINTFGNNKPLIVIDDVIFENGNDQNNNPLALINPEDIQNVVVLKDAASKSIYGSRATAGVILITTKRGRVGKPKISFSSSVGFARPMAFEKPDVLNATELAQFRKEVAIDKLRSTTTRYADPSVPVPDTALPASAAAFLNPSQYGTGTNWYDAVTRQAVTQNHNISVSGGSENVKYFVSGNYLNQEGIVIANDLKRYAFRSNLDVKVSNRVRFGLNLNPSRTESNRSADDPSSGGFSAYSTITSTYWIDPSVSIFQPNGLYNYTTQGALNSNWTANPVYQLTAEQEKRRTTQLLMGTYLEFEPIKNLVFRTAINYGYSQGRSSNFQPANLVSDGNLSPQPPPNLDSARAVLFNTSNNNFISDNTLRYKIVTGKHIIDVLAGVNAQEQTSETSSLSAKKLSDENFILPNFGNVSVASVGNFTGTSGFSKSRIFSIISRLNYSYNDKYLLNFSIRRDGSSRFGRDVQYGTFPAGSLTWRVTEEKFMDKLKNSWLNDLRLEVGYGLTGNSNGVSAYEHLGSVGTANYQFGGTLLLGNSLAGLPNPLLTWEESKQLDLGMNAALFNRRINLAFNYYEQTTEGLLAGIPLSWVTGFGSVTGNQQSKIRNRGFEAQLDAIVVRSRNFTWSTGMNASKYVNKILEYFVPGGFTNGVAGNGTNVAISAPGQPIGMYRGLKILGVYSAEDIADPKVPKYSGARVGGTKYLDGDGNGVLDGNVEKDYVILGNPHPDLMFGWNNQIAYKNFNLRSVVAGQLGGLIYDLRREIMWNVDGNFNVERQILNRWRPGDDPATKSFGSTSFNTNLYRIPSDNKIYDGTYIALKNLTIGYNVAKVLNSRKRMVEAAEFSISMRNVFYIARYKYGNPEVRRANDGSALRGINYGSYPIARTLTVGLNLTF
jgi:TonB-dependent starch-binding outer membrane protein SusC